MSFFLKLFGKKHEKKWERNGDAELWKRNCSVKSRDMQIALIKAAEVMEKSGKGLPQ